MAKIRFNEIYDSSFDILDLTQNDDFDFKQTIVIRQGINIDFDSADKPVSIELIRASRHFGMIPKFFTSQKRDGIIIISRDHITFKMNIHYRGDLRSFEKQIPNDYNINPGEFEFSNF